ncbi:MAG: HAD family hydrolase [Planctomycetes bacterium]|nr:HAD family hydrolase [Planctomycetota bacterium]MBL7146221.1 HAD family hydrolase [Phycisphaerae bacterium]
MPDKKIKAVLFDLGETLLDFGKVQPGQIFCQGARLSYDFLKSCGQPVGNFKYYCLCNMVALQFRRLISGITRNDFNSLALLRWIGVKKGIRLDGQQWRHFAWLWYEPLYKVATVEPDLKETLTKLKNSGLKLGIVSNTFVSGDSLEKHMEQVGILDFFEPRMYSYEFNFRKPDPRIFMIAAERIGEATEKIMFVGDRINMDIEPALKAGMRAVLKTAYTNNGKKIPAGAWKINHISELPALIEKINSQAVSN